MPINEKCSYSFWVKVESLFGKTVMSDQVYVNGDNIAYQINCNVGCSPCRTNIPKDPNTILICLYHLQMSLHQMKMEWMICLLY